MTDPSLHRNSLFSTCNVEYVGGEGGGGDGGEGGGGSETL